MTPWQECRVEWKGPARRDLRRLDRQVAAAIVAAVDAYARTGRGDIRRLHGRPELGLRVREWRVLFVREDGLTIVVQRVLPRGRAYR